MFISKSKGTNEVESPPPSARSNIDLVEPWFVIVKEEVEEDNSDDDDKEEEEKGEDGW